MHISDRQKEAFVEIVDNLPLYLDEKTPDKDFIIKALIEELERIREGWFCRDTMKGLDNLNPWESERYFYLDLLMQKSMSECASCNRN